MRHAIRYRKLGRTTSHRKALRRNLVQSLIEHGQVRTTLPKAKDLRPFAERIISLAVDGSLVARQRAIALLNDRAIIPKEQQAEYDRMSDAKRDKVLRSRSGRRYRASTTKPGVAFTAESVIHRLFATVGPAMKRRAEKRGPGGYTRIIKLAKRRLGDGGEVAILQLVGEQDAARPDTGDKTNRKRKAKLRYAFYAGKPLPKRRARASAGKSPAAEPASDA